MKINNILYVFFVSLIISGSSQAKSLEFKAWGPIQIGETLDDALNTPHEIGNKGASLEDGSVVLYTDINGSYARIDALPSNGVIRSVFISFFPKITNDKNCKNQIDYYTEKLKTEYGGTIISKHMEMFDVIPFSDQQYSGISNSIMISNNNFINIIERKYNDFSCKVTVSFENH